MSRDIKKLFVEICDFCKYYNKQKGLKTNSIETEKVRQSLQELKLWAESKFSTLDGIPLSCAISKGSALFPRIPWLAILPPEQRVSDGVYFVIGFGWEGAGAVAGCNSSVTSRTGLKTVKRSIHKPLKINVNGDRATTKYNDAFANPLEVTPDSFDEQGLQEHIIQSLSISFEYIRTNQNPASFLPESFELENTKLDTSLEDEGSNGAKFDPNNIEDTRKNIIAAIKRRQGQGKFRRELLKAYDSRCAITGFDVSEALEAAHIMPYRGQHTNHPSNGFLLRADLHTLFDLNLIAVDTSMNILLAPSLYETNYKELIGLKIRLPKDKNKQPNIEALAWRLLSFKH